MAKQVINVGTSANDGTGDTLRSGAQKINENFTELYSSVAYSLPISTQSVLGGVKIGSGINVTIDGTISVDIPNLEQYTLPTASTNTLGGVKIDGSTIQISNGVISATGANYSLPTASTSVLGGVKVGTGLTITNGVLSADALGYNLPVATDSVLGGVKIGANITITNGTISVAAPSAAQIQSDWAQSNNIALDYIKNKPTLFSGSYTDLSNKPTIPAAYSSTSISALADVDTTTIQPNLNEVLGWNGVNWVPTSSNASLSSRVVRYQTTSAIPAGATASIEVQGFKGYVLYQIEASAAAWVRLYDTAQSRSSDASRAEGVDPAPASGVIAEIITTGHQTVSMTPAVYGFNGELTPSTDIPIAVTNKGGTAVAITVTLTLLQLEA